MKKLSVLLVATSALFSACGDDDDVVLDMDAGPDGGMDPEGSGGRSGSGGSGGGSTAGGRTGSGGSSGAGTDAGTGGMQAEGGVMPEAGMDSGPSTRTFTVTIENVAPTKLFTSGGVFNTPTGDDDPGPATPGKKYEFSINAGRKQKLSFVTMLAATNDLFFGPNGDGISLYDEDGDPISGDVTDQIQLWDAGTEVNEEPGVGPNTVSKQAMADTGPDENGNVVDISETSDTFDYPAVDEVMTVTVTHVTGTEFTISIENVSTGMALQTSEGDMAAPLSPGVWVVHNGSNPLFTDGMPDRGQGLEHIAEDGNPTMLAAFIADNEGITYPASPGAWVLHSDGSMPLFTDGDADYGDGVEHIAEDGNPTMLGENLSDLDGESDAAVFNMPVGSDDPGPILPGSSYAFTFEASPGDALSFVTMLAATNDVFFAPDDTGIPLFDEDDKPTTGDVTDRVYLWDVGTEANEMPGIGPNTVTNQLAPDTGEDGEGIVQLLSEVNDGYTYPVVDGVLKVTIDVE